MEPENLGISTPHGEAVLFRSEEAACVRAGTRVLTKRGEWIDVDKIVDEKLWCWTGWDAHCQARVVALAVRQLP